jgi:hypothetical protein
MRQFYLAHPEIVQTASGQSAAVDKVQTPSGTACVPTVLVALCATALC